MSPHRSLTTLLALLAALALAAACEVDEPDEEEVEEPDDDEVDEVAVDIQGDPDDELEGAGAEEGTDDGNEDDEGGEEEEAEEPVPEEGIATLETLAGTPLVVDQHEDGNYLAGPAMIVQADVEASNGVIHVTDFVLEIGGLPE